MHTPDITESNIEKIGQLFPNCLSERIGEDGEPEKVIDFDQLRQELSKVIVEGSQERYQFTWPDKKKVIRMANEPSNMTLRPCHEGSVDFEETENLYIEGDNLEVLKLLRENYLGRVKLIYIDPPYNTGGDLLYEDDFSQTASDFRDTSGIFDKEGNMLLSNYDQNTESNGRFHTSWLNMMYPRLKISRDLLREDGVIFISIDDNELENLLKICKEVFGPSNFVNVICVKTNETKGLKNAHVEKGFPKNKEYLVILSKNKNLLNFNISKVAKDESELIQYTRYYNKYIDNINDDCSLWRIEDFSPLAKGKSDADVFKLKNEYKDRLIYLVAPDNVDENKVPQERNKFYKLINKKGVECYYYRDSNGKIYNTLFLGANTYKNLGDLWIDISTININKESCGVPTYANGQKPLKLLERIIKYVLPADEEGYVLDFFSGSATTAHATINVNNADGGKRHFIMVQLPENMDENMTRQNPDQKKATQKLIDFLDSINKPHLLTEIGKERLRRVWMKYNENHDGDSLFASNAANKNIDAGFRVLKLATSNMQDVYYRPEDSTESTLFEDNVKPDRTPEDLLFQVILECNLPLSARIHAEKIAGKDVFSVNNGYLIACFDEDVNEDVIKTIAKRKPYYFVMRDSSLASDNVADNFEQIFQAYSKDTIRKIL